MVRESSSVNECTRFQMTAGFTDGEEEEDEEEDKGDEAGVEGVLLLLLLLLLLPSPGVASNCFTNARSCFATSDDLALAAKSSNTNL